MHAVHSESLPTTLAVVVVGSGPVGAVLARELLETHPSVRVTLVERGPEVGPAAGMNLKNVADPGARARLQLAAQGPAPRFYGTNSLADRARAGIRPDLADADSLARPGTFLLSADGVDTTDMPAAAASRNVGGMGAHWTCACPWPAEDEIVPELRGVWDELRATAESHLQVRSDVYPETPEQTSLLDRLRSLYSGGGPDRRPQRLPMAIRSTPVGPAWVGPSDILGPWTESPRLGIMADALVSRVVLRDGTAVGVRIADAYGVESELPADAVVLAAGAFHTPQLLWASGVGLPAVGRFLNEHTQVISGVRLPDAVHTGAGRTDPVSGVLWVPYSDDFPFHAQITSVDAAPVVTAETASSRTLTLSWFVPTELNEDNRIERIEGEVDRYGLPAMRIRFVRSSEDLRRARSAADMQVDLASVLGEPVDERGPVTMPPGSSLHYAGTTRIGARDDGTSVCSPAGLVWGTANLYVAGTGTISTAVAGNPTLAAAAIAVGTARHIAAREALPHL